MVAGRVLVGEFGRPHGVRGLLRLRSYTADPAAIVTYPLTDEAGTRRFAVTLLPDFVARVEGVADRDAAARLTGTRLYVERALLPPADEDEWYLADLVGLAAEAPDGTPLGRVRALEEHGAGSFLILDDERMVPFTRACVPMVDVPGGRVVVEFPGEITVAPDAAGADQAA